MSLLVTCRVFHTEQLWGLPPQAWSLLQQPSSWAIWARGNWRPLDWPSAWPTSQASRCWSGFHPHCRQRPGQAYGAKNFEEVCLSLQRCLLLCTVVLGVVGMLWLNSRSLLIATGQEEAVADLAASYLMYLFPGLCCYMVTICLENWLAAQRITIVQGTGGVILLASFVPLCWILVQPLHMETNGAAIATSLGHLFLMLWMIGQTFIAIRSSLTMSWQGLSRRAFTDWCPFLHLAVPSLFVISDPWFAHALWLVWEWNTKAEGSKREGLAARGIGEGSHQDWLS